MKSTREFRCVEPPELPLLHAPLAPLTSRTVASPPRSLAKKSYCNRQDGRCGTLGNHSQHATSLHSNALKLTRHPSWWICSVGKQISLSQTPGGVETICVTVTIVTLESKLPLNIVIQWCELFHFNCPYFFINIHCSTSCCRWYWLKFDDCLRYINGNLCPCPRTADSFKHRAAG